MQQGKETGPTFGLSTLSIEGISCFIPGNDNLQRCEMKPVMEELILTLSVIMVYNVSVGAVGGVGLTGDREPWALLLHGEKLLSLNTAAAAVKTCPVISPVHANKTHMVPILVYDQM